MLNIKNNHLRHQFNRIAKIRKVIANGGKLGVVEIRCAGGCGTVARIRADKIKAGHFFVCNNRATRGLCGSRVPFGIGGKVITKHHQAAASFTGIEYTDQGRFVYGLARCLDAIRHPVSLLAHWLHKRAKVDG